MFDQAVRIFAHLEEIRLLLRRLHLAPTIRAFPVYELRLCPEGFARRTVKPLVRALVNVALLIQLLKDLLYLPLMIIVRRADELIIRSVHKIPDRLYLPGHPVYELLRRNVRLLRLQLYLLSMLVRSRLEKYVIALAPLIPCDRVRQDDLVSIPDMRLSRCVRDSRRNIILLLLHLLSPPVILK